MPNWKTMTGDYSLITPKVPETELVDVVKTREEAEELFADQSGWGYMGTPGGPFEVFRSTRPQQVQQQVQLPETPQIQLDKFYAAQKKQLSTIYAYRDTAGIDAIRNQSNFLIEIANRKLNRAEEEYEEATRFGVTYTQRGRAQVERNFKIAQDNYKIELESIREEARIRRRSLVEESLVNYQVELSKLNMRRDKIKAGWETLETDDRFSPQQKQDLKLQMLHREMGVPYTKPPRPDVAGIKEKPMPIGQLDEVDATADRYVAAAVAKSGYEKKWWRGEPGPGFLRWSTILVDEKKKKATRKDIEESYEQYKIELGWTARSATEKNTMNLKFMQALKRAGVPVEELFEEVEGEYAGIKTCGRSC